MPKRSSFGFSVVLESDKRITDENEAKRERKSEVLERQETNSTSMETEVVVKPEQPNQAQSKPKKTTFLSLIGRIIRPLGRHLAERLKKKKTYLKGVIYELEIFLATDRSEVTLDQYSSKINLSLKAYEVALELYNDGEITKDELNKLKTLGDTLIIKARLRELQIEVSSQKNSPNLQSKIQNTYTELTQLYEAANGRVLDVVNAAKSQLKPWLPKVAVVSEPPLEAPSKKEADEPSYVPKRIQEQLRDAERYFATAMESSPVLDLDINFSSEQVFIINLEMALTLFEAVENNKNNNLSEKETQLLQNRILTIIYILPNLDFKAKKVTSEERDLAFKVKKITASKKDLNFEKRKAVAKNLIEFEGLQKEFDNLLDDYRLRSRTVIKALPQKLYEFENKILDLMHRTNSDEPIKDILQNFYTTTKHIQQDCKILIEEYNNELSSPVLHSNECSFFNETSQPKQLQNKGLWDKFKENMSRMVDFLDANLNH